MELINIGSISLKIYMGFQTQENHLSWITFELFFYFDLLTQFEGKVELVDITAGFGVDKGVSLLLTASPLYRIFVYSLPS